MANHANSTPVPAVAALHADAIARVEGLKFTAQILADRLRDVMKEIHGGAWSFDINHVSQFISICQDDLGCGAIAPRRGEVV